MPSYLLSNPIVRALLGLAVVVAILAGTYRAGVSEGYDRRAQEQAEVDAKTYAEIIKEIENAGVDPSDPDAVLRELCRLSGVADVPECRDL